MSCLNFLLFVTFLAASNLGGAFKLNGESMHDQKEQPSPKSRSSVARTLQSSNAEAPKAAPERSPLTSPQMEPARPTCKDFKEEIAAAMLECEETVIVNNCEWLQTCGFMGSELQVDHHHNPKTCCCACQSVKTCQALQREFLTGRCIFHCGGMPRFTEDYFSFCWEKQLAVQ